MRIGKHADGRDLKLGYRRLHSRGIIVTDACDLNAWMFAAFAKQIAHMHVIEVQADNLESFHGGMFKIYGAASNNTNVC